MSCLRAGERRVLIEPYYYSLLDKSQQAIYHRMLTGLQELAFRFPVPLIDNKELSRIYSYVLYDHPEIFYSMGYIHNRPRGAENGEMEPEYMFDRKTILHQRQALTTRVEKLAALAKAAAEEVVAREERQNRERRGAARSKGKFTGKDRRMVEEMIWIHDFLCTSVRYDKEKKEYAHMIIGPLGHGVGVCEGISKAFKAVCDVLGIWCIVVVSDPDPEHGVKDGHMWNMVKVGEKYYQIDATYDNYRTDSGILRHDYFMLADREFYWDHDRPSVKMPACEDGGHSYYREKGMSFTSKEEAVKYARKHFRKEGQALLHWGAGFMRGDEFKEIGEALAEDYRARKEEEKESGKLLAGIVNYPQSVIYMRLGTPDECEKPVDDTEKDEEAVWTERVRNLFVEQMRFFE